MSVMKCLVKLSLLGILMALLAGCDTLSEMVTSNLPESHGGRPKIVVDLSEQEAYLYRDGHLTASSRISSGREGHRTTTGRFSVIRCSIAGLGRAAEGHGRVLREQDPHGNVGEMTIGCRRSRHS